MSKCALVLEGGGLRGIYVAGVLDVLMRNKIYVDAVFGVSAGALFGVNYKSKQIGRAIRYNRKYVNDKRYMGIYSLITTGNIMNKEFCFDKLVNELEPFDFDTFKKTKMEFYAVASDLSTGGPVYFEITDIRDPKQSEMLRASGSLPLISKKVEIDGNYYLDGGITDSIPVKEVIRRGYEKVIVVCTRPIEYRKTHKNTSYFKLWYKEYPKFLETINKRPDNYNATLDYIEEQEKKKRIMVIRPSKFIKVGRLEKDVNVINEQYNLGMSDTENKLKDIKKYIGIK